MGARVIEFTIPEDIAGVKIWFVAALQPLAGVPHREDYQVELILSAPHMTERAIPVARAEIAVMAVRIRYVPVPSDWLPEFFIERIEHRKEHLGPVMRFRFAALDRGTYVRADCSGQLLPVLNIFVGLLKQVQACYPAIGPVWQPYEAERIARLTDVLDRTFGAVEGDAIPAPQAPPAPQVPGTSEVPGTLAAPSASAKAAPAEEGLPERSSASVRAAQSKDPSLHRREQPTPWDDTLAHKLPRLRQIRRDAIQRKAPKSFTVACAEVPIDPKTARKHAPDLRRRWDDPTYDMAPFHGE